MNNLEAQFTLLQRRLGAIAKLIAEINSEIWEIKQALVPDEDEIDVSKDFWTKSLDDDEEPYELGDKF